MVDLLSLRIRFVKELPDMMSTSEGGHGKADIVRGVS